MKSKSLMAVVVIAVLAVTGVILAQRVPGMQQDPESTPEPVAPEATAEPTPVAEYPGAQPVEAGGLRFLLPGWVANGATGSQVEALPFDPDAMTDYPAPAHDRIEFVDYLPDDAPEITHDFNYEPVILVFDTADFPEWRFNEATGYDLVLDDLQSILSERPDLEDLEMMPYLPLANASQVFHAREQYVRFHDGWGIAYLTAFAQAVDPVLEGTVWLTFQGVTDNGMTYIAAVFPIDTNLLPEALDPDMNHEAFATGFDEYLADLRRDLNAQPAEGFAPPLDAILALLGSIDVIEQ